MGVPPRLDQLEALAGGFRGIAHDRQAVASLRPIGRKGGDNRVASDPRSSLHAGDVGGAVVHFGRIWNAAQPMIEFGSASMRLNCADPGLSEPQIWQWRGGPR